MHNKSLLLHIAVFVMAFALVACDGSGNGVNASSNTITDARDGQSYSTVTIGSQIWMAENLNYAMEGSYCYADDPANCAEFGRLYTYEAAMRACPAGWHLPSRTEWDALFDAIDGWLGGLKSTSGWEEKSNGNDFFGFSALPAGVRKNSGRYRDKGEDAYFWSSTEKDSGNAYRIHLDYLDRDNPLLVVYTFKVDAFSVRCLKD